VPAACLAAVALVALQLGCGAGRDGPAKTDGAGHTSAAVADSVPAGGSAEALEAQFERVVADVSPKVVQIESPGGLGSGVVYNDKGDIVTNAHVVGNGKRFTVTLGRGEQRKATLVASYPPGDLAVVHLTDATPEPAQFADSSKVKVGQFALAIGNPLGLRSSVTQGIVSSLGRTVSEGPGQALTSAIQTSAPINPGNSGGALVELDGEVIGIPTLAALDPQLGGSQAPGIGFAIPSNTVRDIADQMVKYHKVLRTGRGWLGVSIASLTGGGVLVAGVRAGGPADKAGIQPGDLIVSVDGMPTPSADDLTTVLATLKPGRRVTVEVERDGARKKLQVTLGELPAG
jgi:S1-C subfamily serine protease